MTNNNNAVPPAIVPSEPSAQAIPAPDSLLYTAGKPNPPHSRFEKAGALPETALRSKADTSDAAATPQYVYSGLTAQDLAYDTTQYPISGTYSGVLPPWLNDLTTVPGDWQTTDADKQASDNRSKQVNAALAYSLTNVPKQQYTANTTAGLIAQFFTLGMWDPAVFDATQVATLTQNWIADDSELGRQRLGGGNPNVIKAASGKYNIPQWIEAATNGAGLSALKYALLAAQNAGALFVCDYTPVLGTVVLNQFVRKGKYLTAPIGFFTIDPATNALLPQAIQINGLDSKSYIFSPGDSTDPQGDAWLLAKLWLASADQQWWYSGSHLFNTHTIDMLFGTAALNLIQTGVLASAHPLVILAKPYLQKSFNINSAVINMPSPSTGGTGIYQYNQFVDQVLPTGRIGLYQIISNLYQGYSFDDNAFPAQLANRGLTGGPIDKVVFPYRDDGQIWWNAISAFVGQIVDATYASDAAVFADKALNAWLGAVQAAFNHDGTTRFTWTPSVAYLKSVFSNLLYTCSVQHTSVNNTMFNGWAFPPNGPFAMQQPPPANAAGVTRQTVLSSLPFPQNVSALTAVIQPQVAFVMNGTATVSETLGVSQSDGQAIYAVYPYAAGSAQYNAVGAFWNAIWSGSGSVSARIAANQAARIASWKGSTPVPNSLAYPYLSANLTAWSPPQYLNAPATNAIQI